MDPISVETMWTVGIIATSLPDLITMIVDSAGIVKDSQKKLVAFLMCFVFAMVIIIIEGLITVPAIILTLVRAGFLAYFVATTLYRLSKVPEILKKMVTPQVLVEGAETVNIGDSSNREVVA